MKWASLVILAVLLPSAALARDWTWMNVDPYRCEPPPAAYRSPFALEQAVRSSGGYLGTEIYVRDSAVMPTAVGIRVYHDGEVGSILYFSSMERCQAALKAVPGRQELD